MVKSSNITIPDVNGKVVHLVERAPPRASRSGDTTTNTSTPQPTQNNRRSNNFGDAFRRALDLDGMVVGAMAIPMGGNAGTTHALTTTVNPSSTLCMNRIAVARHMLECANNIVTFLENPERVRLSSFLRLETIPNDMLNFRV